MYGKNVNRLNRTDAFASYETSLTVSFYSSYVLNNDVVPRLSYGAYFGIDRQMCMQSR